MDLARQASASGGEEYPAFAWPGGYPIFYILGDGGTICPDCANGKNNSDAAERHPDPVWRLVACDVHWEGDPLVCDHCYIHIASAYGPVEGK